MKKLFPYLFSFLILIPLGSCPAQAQITGAIKAKVPFSFYVDNTRFPAGSYVIRNVRHTDLNTMEITKSDDSMSALFAVRESVDKTTPKGTELVFKHYNNHYYLSRLYDATNKLGVATIPNTGYAKDAGSMDGAEDTHVPATNSGT